MLRNDPPPGTRVRCVLGGDIGILLGPLRRYVVESADDEFRVRFHGEETIARRADIEEA
jgi:hypothetical protein